MGGKMRIIKNKQGVCLSINTIIITVLAILVLVIVAFLVARQLGLIGPATSCITEGGVCRSDCPYENTISGSNLCKNPSMTCCSPNPINEPN